mmetsp:Transcript_18338/g.38156  ORF Transcript_18338/g.38156 Transcript_18338/m.38156 type:complete len:220 (-) Transcript_18338:1344-2003(-)
MSCFLTSTPSSSAFLSTSLPLDLTPKANTTPPDSLAKKTSLWVTAPIPTWMMSISMSISVSSSSSMRLCLTACNVPSQSALITTGALEVSLKASSSACLSLSPKSGMNLRLYLNSISVPCCIERFLASILVLTLAAPPASSKCTFFADALSAVLDIFSPYNFSLLSAICLATASLLTFTRVSPAFGMPLSPTILTGVDGKAVFTVPTPPGSLMIFTLPP